MEYGEPGRGTSFLSVKNTQNEQINNQVMVSMSYWSESPCYQILQPDAEELMDTRNKILG